MKKGSLQYLRLAVSLLLIAFFALSVEGDWRFHLVEPWGWVYLLLTVVLANLDRVLMSYKWNILLRAKTITVPFTEVVRSYYMGTFWGSLLLTSVGGDVVRAYQISGRTNTAGGIISSVVLERLLGAMAAFLVGTLSLGLFAILVGAHTWKIAVGLSFSFLFFLGLIILSFNTRLLHWVGQRFPHQKQGWLGKLSEVYGSYFVYRHHRGPMLRFFLWSLFEQYLPILCVFFVSQALNFEVPFWSFVIFVPVIVAVSKIPVSLDGFGVNEGLYIYFFSFVGMSGAEAFLLGLLSHIAGIAAVLPGFFYFSFCFPALRTTRQDAPRHRYAEPGLIRFKEP